MHVKCGCAMQSCLLLYLNIVAKVVVLHILKAPPSGVRFSLLTASFIVLDKIIKRKKVTGMVVKMGREN